MKKGLCLLLAAALLVSLCGCSDIVGSALLFFFAAANDDRATKAEIIAFVQEQEDALLQAVESGDYAAFADGELIRDIEQDQEIVDFFCGGAGIGSNTSYVGFYYTSTHDMTALWCAPGDSSALVASGNGYEWQEPAGDNRYYTEHICGNFYYYEADF